MAGFPGLNIRQTSDKEYGQIYVPVVNWMMMVCTLFLTFSFGSSDSLAGAYGTAVSTTMLLTTALLFNAMRDVWRWPFGVALLVSGVFLLIDLAFFGANLLKITEGGWIPAAAGALIFTAMTTWHRGIEAIRALAGAEAGIRRRVPRETEERHGRACSGDGGVLQPQRHRGARGAGRATSPRSRRCRKPSSA